MVQGSATGIVREPNIFPVTSVNRVKGVVVVTVVVVVVVAVVSRL